jgi:hypothetical protein
MKLDPVLAEIRAAREAFSERFGGDVSAMLADLRKRQAENGRTLVRLPPKRLPTDELRPASVVELEKMKETVMQIPVAIVPTELGGFRAESASPFTVVAEGSTREEAVSKVQAELNQKIESGSVVMVEVGARVENPWLAMAGWLKDDPLYDEWQAAIKEYRRERNLEDGIETHDGT